MREPEKIVHPIPPFWQPDSRILILGSFPSMKTREMGFFYGHPQNRFWKVMAAVWEESIPGTVAERKEFLRRHQIAAWDVIFSCTIVGSSDSSIRDVTVTDLAPILESARIRQIYVNGRKAEELYRKYSLPRTGREAVCLPSTSPANAAWSLERLTDAWKRVKNAE